MSVAYTVNGGFGIRDYRIDADDPLPFDNVPDGSSLMMKSNQKAGVMFFSAGNQCWYDQNGKAWTKEDVTWKPEV